MPRVILHIGLEKTGTTSIQRFLSANHRRLIERHRVLYPLHPSLCRDDAHTPLTAGLLPASACDFISPEARPGVTDMIDALEASLDKAPETLIFSAEHLSSRLDRASIAQLAQLLCLFAVEILVYVRTQAEMGVSAFSTHLKCGRRDWFLPREISPKNPYYDVVGMLAPWVEIFGQDAIRLRVFDPQQLHRGDIIDDVLAMIGIQDTTGLEREAPLNTSLNLAEAALLHRFNQCVPTWEEAVEQGRPQDYHHVHQLRLKILEEAASIPDLRNAPPLSSLLTAWDRLRIGQRFARTNARIARDYLGGDQLFRESARPGIASQQLIMRPKPPLDAQQLAEILLALMDRLDGHVEIPIKTRLADRLTALLRKGAQWSLAQPVDRSRDRGAATLDA
ncbi:hypothetical protein [Thiocystis violacea]|uniref:hypothetical protein n=1 Tax=Thiocystis violacea TaxID=13725 RepID=UPI001903702C|nr:hypothetical protein [Thiocystis violacea]